MTAPTPFKQNDVKRAIKGALTAGLDVGRVEIDREGTIVICAKGSALNSNVDDIDRMIGLK